MSICLNRKQIHNNRHLFQSPQYTNHPGYNYENRTDRHIKCFRVVFKGFEWV